MPPPPRHPASDRSAIARLRPASLVSCLVLVVLGAGVFALGLLPSDAPDFFRLHGALLAAGGAAGMLPRLVRPFGGRFVAARVAAALVNAAVAIRVLWLVVEGTVRGPLLVGAPMMLALPAGLNVLAAALGVTGRRLPPGACPGCGYDRRGAPDGPCPECGGSTGDDRQDRAG